MRCFVYKSLRKADTYLYLGQRDDFARVPDALRRPLGELSFVLDFELDPGRKLARGDATVVLQNLLGPGFHLQFPTRMDALVPRAQDAQERPPRMDALVPRAAVSGVLPSTALAQSFASQDAQERPPDAHAPVGQAQGTPAASPASETDTHGKR